MKYTYTYTSPSKSTATKIKNHKVFEKEVTTYIQATSTKNAPEYNAILSDIKKLTNTLSVKASASKIFKQELTDIQKKKPLSEPTVWGGVTLKKVDVAKDFIQKLLIIKKYGVLGFEIHEKKHEHLKIVEGCCLVFWINHRGKPKTTITIQIAGPKDEFTFEPKDEHGILTLTDCIIEETSTNHLDDLVYIFNAHL